MKAAELKTRVEKEERGLGPGGLEGTGEDGWIIELGADRRFVHWDWAWTSLDWANRNEKLIPSPGVGLKIRSRIRVKHRPSLSSQGEARNSIKCSLFNISAAQEVGLAAPPTRSGF